MPLPPLMAIHQSISLRVTHSDPPPPRVVAGAGLRVSKRASKGPSWLLASCFSVVYRRGSTQLPPTFPPVIGLLSSMQDSLALGKALNTAARRHPRRGAHKANDKRGISL